MSPLAFAPALVMDVVRYKRGRDSIFAVPSFPPQGAFVKLYRWSCYCASLSSVSVNSTTAGEEGESRRKERKRRRDNDFHLVRYAAAATKVHNSPNDTNEISLKLISWCSTFCIKTILCFESQKIVEFHTFEREGFFFFLPSFPSPVLSSSSCFSRVVSDRRCPLQKGFRVERRRDSFLSRKNPFFSNGKFLSHTGKKGEL